MDAEFQDKVELTWDADFEKKALQWIAAMTGIRFLTSGSCAPLNASLPGEHIPPELPMFDALKSGVLLCRAANKIRPNLIPNIGTKALGMVERENIQQYLLACQRLGMQPSDLFTISDLHDRRYMPGVLHNIMALAKVAESMSNLGMMPKTPRTTAAVSRAKEVVERNTRT
jgi:transgelin